MITAQLLRTNWRAPKPDFVGSIMPASGVLYLLEATQRNAHWLDLVVNIGKRRVGCGELAVDAVTTVMVYGKPWRVRTRKPVPEGLTLEWEQGLS